VAGGTLESDGAGVGKYLKAPRPVTQGRDPADEDEVVEFMDAEPDPGPARKKVKGGSGFGNFDSW